MKINKTIQFLLLSVVLLLGFTACKSHLQPGGAYDPATTTYTTNADSTISTNVVETAAPNIALFNIDSAFEIAYMAADLIFKQEKLNRQLLEGISINIKHTLDTIRPKALEVRARYTKGRRIYLLNPTPAGLTDLQTILSEMQGIAAAAQGALPQSSPKTN